MIFNFCWFYYLYEVFGDKRLVLSCVVIFLFFSELWGKNFNLYENIFVFRFRIEVKILNEWFKISENFYCNSNER